LRREPWEEEIVAAFLIILLLGLAAVAIAYFALFGTMPKSNCDVCGAELKRNRYTYEINGAPATLCPNCNRAMERKTSKSKMKRFEQTGKLPNRPRNERGDA
jgi:hypothetical protein